MSVIIEAINETVFREHLCKPGTQLNLTPKLAEFMVEVNGNWKYIKGHQTKLEKEVFDKHINEEDDAPKAKKGKKK